MAGRQARGLGAFVGYSISQICHEIYADMKKRVAYHSWRAKDALAKGGECDLGNCDFPLSAIRHTFATKSPRDDLMTETYSCACPVLTGPVQCESHTHR
jgi:hypothetical protein